jgi:hypothetical protein
MDEENFEDAFAVAVEQDACTCACHLPKRTVSRPIAQSGGGRSIAGLPQWTGTPEFESTRAGR